MLPSRCDSASIYQLCKELAFLIAIGYPHYDAYRVVAPVADAWREYDRWGGERIRWGAPLETIGDMCHSLR